VAPAHGPPYSDVVNLAAVAAIVVVTAGGGVAAKHVVETATGGSVEAAFSYDYNAKTYRFSNPHLTIKRSGTILVDGAVKPLASYAEVDPAKYFVHKKSVSVRDLDGDAEPEVVIDLYWGGAHCCWYTQVYRYIASANAYLVGTHVWGDLAYRTADLDHDGLKEFVSGDDRFSYEFTSFAASSWPVQIWTYRAGRFLDVTRRFPVLIRRDARREWHLALTKQNRGDNTGLLAAWAGDQCLRGRCASAFKQLGVLRREGRIGLGWDKTARRYLAHLRRFLRRLGYLG
jgi:hypothetical protein